MLQYDEVMNEQRKIIYAQRQSVLDGEDISGTIASMIESVVNNAMDDFIGITEIPDTFAMHCVKLKTVGC